MSTLHRLTADNTINTTTPIQHCALCDREIPYGSRYCGGATCESRKDALTPAKKAAKGETT